MKKLCYLFFAFFIPNVSNAQLPDGSTVPDFTFTDILGNTQNLYSYLNQGKFVVLDISATWCAPCWTYHNQKVIDSLYDLHDTPGDKTWKVLFFEADANTTNADLYGTGTNTQGNWVAGSNYAIIDPPGGAALSSFKTGYNISFFPTLSVICPNKKIYQDTLNGPRPTVNTWEYVAGNVCSLSGLDILEDTRPVSMYPNPAKNNTTIYFALNQPAPISITVTDVLGHLVESRSLGSLFPGDQKINFDLSHLQGGVYFFTISTNSRSIIKKLIVE